MNSPLQKHVGKMQFIFAEKKGTSRDRTKRAIYGIAIIDESCAHFDVGEIS